MRKHITIDTTTGETKTEDVPQHLASASPRQMLEQLMDDCPECRAARARGEEPLFIDVPPPPRDIIRGRRPRWRKLKRTAGR